MPHSGCREATLKLDEDEAYEVDGAVVIGQDGEIVERGVHARWLDAAGGMFGMPPRALEIAEAMRVWARPLGNGLWRRGRLRVEPDRVVFRDEPSATNGLRGSGERAGLACCRGAVVLGGSESLQKGLANEPYPGET